MILTVSPSYERLSAVDGKIAAPGFDDITEDRFRPMKASSVESGSEDLPNKLFWKAYE